MDGREIEALRKETHRLREALERIANYDSFQGGPIAPRETLTEAAMRRIAREALDGGVG